MQVGDRVMVLGGPIGRVSDYLRGLWYVIAEGDWREFPYSTEQLAHLPYPRVANGKEVLANDATGGHS